MTAPRYFAWDDDLIIPFTVPDDATSYNVRAVTAADALAMVGSILSHVDRPDDPLDLDPWQAVESIAALMAGRSSDGRTITLPDYSIPECDEQGNEL